MIEKIAVVIADWAAFRPLWMVLGFLGLVLFCMAVGFGIGAHVAIRLVMDEPDDAEAPKPHVSEIP